MQLKAKKDFPKLQDMISEFKKTGKLIKKLWSEQRTELTFRLTFLFKNPYNLE